MPDDVTWPQRCCEAVRSAVLATAWLLVCRLTSNRTVCARACVCVWGTYRNATILECSIKRQYRSQGDLHTRISTESRYPTADIVVKVAGAVSLLFSRDVSLASVESPIATVSQHQQPRDWLSSVSAAVNRHYQLACRQRRQVVSYCIGLIEIGLRRRVDRTYWMSRPPPLAVRSHFTRATGAIDRHYILVHSHGVGVRSCCHFAA